MLNNLQMNNHIKVWFSDKYKCTMKGDLLKFWTFKLSINVQLCYFISLFSFDDN